MQLSAPTLPLDPNSASSPTRPGSPGSGPTAGDATAEPGAFGALLNAESAPAPTPADHAADAPFVLGQNLPAANAPASGAAAPFSLGLNFATPATAVAAEPEPSSETAATADDVTEDPSSANAEGKISNADAFASWLAANGLPAQLAGVPLAAASTPTVSTASPGTVPPFATTQTSGPFADPKSLAGGSGRVGGGTAMDTLSAGKSIRASRLLRGTQGGSTETPAASTPLPATGTPAAEEMLAQSLPQNSPPASAADASPESAPTAPFSSSAQNPGPDLAGRVFRSGDSRSLCPSPEAVSPATGTPAFESASSVTTPPTAATGPQTLAATTADATSGVALIGMSTTSDNSREKFAAGSQDFADVAATLEKFGIKKSLTITKEEVAKRSAPLGINVAKSSDAMSTLAPTPVRPSTDDPSSTFSVPSLDFAALVKEQPQPSVSELTDPARRTVESVLAVADRFTTTGGQHGVNLKFMVSGMELAVRVEVRGGTVQTTFRTDSPELRAALAVEWRAVAATSDDRSQRLAEPVFTSSSSRDSLQSDAGTTDQRGARQGQPAPEPGSLLRATLRRPSTVTTVSVPVPSASVSTSNRLHTFA